MNLLETFEAELTAALLAFEAERPQWIASLPQKPSPDASDSGSCTAPAYHTDREVLRQAFTSLLEPLCTALDAAGWRVAQVARSAAMTKVAPRVSITKYDPSTNCFHHDDGALFDILRDGMRLASLGISMSVIDHTAVPHAAWRDRRPYRYISIAGLKDAREQKGCAERLREFLLHLVVDMDAILLDMDQHPSFIEEDRRERQRCSFSSSGTSSQHAVGEVVADVASSLHGSSLKELLFCKGEAWLERSVHTRIEGRMYTKVTFRGTLFAALIFRRCYVHAIRLFEKDGSGVDVRDLLSDLSVESNGDLLEQFRWSRCNIMHLMAIAPPRCEAEVVDAVKLCSVVGSEQIASMSRALAHHYEPTGSKARRTLRPVAVAAPLAQSLMHDIVCVATKFDPSWVVNFLRVLPKSPERVDEQVVVFDLVSPHATATIPRHTTVHSVSLSRDAAGMLSASRAAHRALRTKDVVVVVGTHVKEDRSVGRHRYKWSAHDAPDHVSPSRLLVVEEQQLETVGLPFLLVAALEGGLRISLPARFRRMFRQLQCASLAGIDFCLLTPVLGDGVSPATFNWGNVDDCDHSPETINRKCVAKLGGPPSVVAVELTNPQFDIDHLDEIVSQGAASVPTELIDAVKATTLPPEAWRITINLGTSPTTTFEHVATGARMHDHPIFQALGFALSFRRKAPFGISAFKAAAREGPEKLLDFVVKAHEAEKSKQSFKVPQIGSGADPVSGCHRLRRYVPQVACPACGLPGVVERDYDALWRRAGASAAHDVLYDASHRFPLFSGAVHPDFPNLEELAMFIRSFRDYFYVAKLRETLSLGFRVVRGERPRLLSYDVLSVVASFLMPNLAIMMSIWDRLCADQLLQIANASL